MPVALDRFVGRGPDLSRVRSLLRSARLVTVVGPGGAGKTRLAVEHARGVRTAWVVALESLDREHLLADVVATALHVPDREGMPVLDALAAAIGDTAALLVLDNCEHLLDASARLADHLLRACPGLRILATSREPLRVPGEVVFRLAGLALPAPGASPHRSDAVDLFLDRARASAPGHDLTPADAATVAEICRRLEGLPLAIELAARRVGALPVNAVLAGLDNQLALLTGGARTGPARHRALRDTIAWSHRLLDADEQILFRRLSVLVGGFDVGGATAVATAHGAAATPRAGAAPGTGPGSAAGAGPDAGAVAVADVLALLCALEAKSLLVRVPGETARFRQLAPIRAYARERLVAAGEEAATRRLAVDWLARRARPVEGTLLMAGAHAEELQREHENLAALTRYAADDGDGRHLLLAAALARAWQQRGHITAGRRLLDEALLRDSPDDGHRASALALAARLACIQADHERGAELAAAAVRIERARDSPASLANALSAHAYTLMCQDQFPAAVAVLRESVATIRPVGPPLVVATFEHHLAWALVNVDAVDEAESLMASCLPVLSADGSRGAQVAARHTAGTIRLAKGDLDAAARDFEAILRLAGADTFMLAYPLEGLAIIAAHAGDPVRAFRLAGAATFLREQFHTTAEARWRRQLDAALRAATDALSTAKSESATRHGRSLHGERLVDYALAQRPDGGLTARELQIARLVAEGLTNRQIAARLDVAASTVATHLDHVRDKWGLRSRAQIAARFAAWAADTS